MKVTIMLGDFARVSEGKLDVLGGGWSFTGPEPVTLGLGVLVEVPWDQTDRTHSLELLLLGEDGELAPIPTAPDQPPSAIAVQTEFSVPRPVGVPAGAPVPFPLAINFANVPLPPGQRYEWRVRIDGESAEGWYVGFQTRAAEPPVHRPGPGDPAGW